MRTYETIFILKSELTTEEQEKHIEFYKENITSHGGEIVKMEVWGKQALAYPIEKSTEGFYVLIQFKAEGDYVNDELEKRYQFNEDVIRYVIVMLDEKKFKQNPRKEPVRRERPADKAGKAKSENGEELDSNMGCNLEHDIICYNKNLYKSEVTNSAEYNIQDSKIPENGIEVKFDSEFEKNTNKYLFGTFGIDISIPFYAAASRPEKLEIPNTSDFGTFKNKQFYKYDKNGVIPYGDLRTFTINSISSNNSWGNKPSITANDGFVEPIYFTTFFPPKVGPYDEEKSVTELRDIGYDIWLKGKNTQFASDNNLDEKFEPLLGFIWEIYEKIKLWKNAYYKNGFIKK